MHKYITNKKYINLNNLINININMSLYILLT